MPSRYSCLYSPELRRWLILAAVLIGALVFLLLLPQSFSVALFAGMLAFSLLFWARILLRPALQCGWRRLAWLRRWVNAHPTITSRLLAGGTCLAAVLATVSFQPVNGSYWPAYVQGVQNGLLLLALGGVSLSLSLRLSPVQEALPLPTSTALSPARSDWRVAGLGVLTLAILAEANGQVFGLDFLMGLSPKVQLVGLVGGIGLLVWGLGGSVRLCALPRALPRQHRREVLLVLAITAAALLFRLWRLGEVVRVLVDELNFIAPIFSYWEGEPVLLLRPFGGMIPFPWIYPYLQAGGIAVLGRGLAGFRVLSVVIGALTIPALYVLARHLFDRKTALVAAVLLVTFPPHYHFSRIGLNNIADPLFGTLAMAGLAAGLRCNRRLYFALGGAMLGLTQYFYEGGRLLFPLLALFWLGIGWLIWRPHPPRLPVRARLPLRALILAALAAVIVAVPIYYTLVGIEWPLAGRLSLAGLNDEYWAQLFTPEGLQKQSVRLAATLLIYVHRAENSVFYGGETPLVLPVLAPLLLLGVLYVLRRWRQPGPLLLILWVIGTSLGNSLLVDSAASSRYVVIFPALVLFIAVGIRYLLPLLWPVRGERFRRWVLVGLVALISVVHVTYYFGPHLDVYNRQVRPNMDIIDAMLRAADFPQETLTFLVSDNLNEAYAAGMLALLVDDRQVQSISPGEVTVELLADLPAGRPYAFFVEPHDERLPEVLADTFPNLEPPAYTPYTDVPPWAAFTLYYVPAAGESSSSG